MNFVKKFGAWIALGVVLLVLLVVQFLVVGGKRAAAIEENEQAAKKLKNFERTVKDLDSVPTKADLDAARKHLDAIKAMGVEVREKWREMTGGLNQFMSNGEREEGTVKHPVTGEVIPTTLFAQEIVKLYQSMFDSMQTRLAEMMEPKLATMIADSKFSNNVSLTSEAAAVLGKRLATSRVRAKAKVVQADDLIPVTLNDRYDPPNNTPDKMWKDWRCYLVARDIFTRVVPACEVEVPRSLSTVLPATDEERAKVSSIGEDDPMAQQESKGEPQRVVRKLKGWRWIEKIEKFKVDNLVPGNAELAGRPKEGGEGEAAQPAATPPAAPPAPGVEVRYHDTFTVTIELVAHMKVIQKFMSEVLRGEGVWYVPVSAQYSRYDAASVIGDYDSEEAKRWQSIQGGIEGVVVPLQTVAGFEHEPPVKAKLVYKVYRFRYEDTDNPPPAAAQPAGPGQGMRPYEP